MNDVLAQSEAGREIARRNWERGFMEGRAEAMRALLRARFGDLDELDELDQLASRLARYEFESTITWIVTGVTLAELRIRSMRRATLPADRSSQPDEVRHSNPWA